VNGSDWQTIFWSQMIGNPGMTQVKPFPDIHASTSLMKKP
jgi:hypothetical protein